jgi:hypothetical protein
MLPAITVAQWEVIIFWFYGLPGMTICRSPAANSQATGASDAGPLHQSFWAATEAAAQRTNAAKKLG